MLLATSSQSDMEVKDEQQTLTEVTGKSSLAVRFVDGHFVESYYPTIENTFSKEIRWKNQDYSTEIVDTAGQVRFLFPQSFLTLPK